MEQAIEKELDLFSNPPRSANVEEVEWQEFRPTTQFTPNSKVVFDIAGSPNLYYELKWSILKVKARLLKNDGSIPSMALNDEKEMIDDVSPVNLLLHSMWSQLEIALQQKVITKIGDTHAYKAYLDALLETSAAQKESSLLNQLFVKDNSGAQNETSALGTNIGLSERSAVSMNGKIMDMQGPLYDDVAEQDRYILNGVPLKISLWPSSSAFCLISEKEDYKLEVIDVALHLCCVKVSPELIQAHDKMLQQYPAKYPFQMSDVRTFNVPKGQYACTIQNLFEDQIPQRVVVAMVTSEAYNGRFQENPYNFQHFNLTSAGFYVDGKSVPRAPLQTNFESREVAEAYGALVRVNPEAGITSYDFVEGYTLLVFDLRKSLFREMHSGNTKLELKFAKPLPDPITVIAYAKIPAMVEIDKVRSVSVIV